MDSNETILVRVSGPDRPGISAGILRVLDDVDASVQDIEQVIIRKQLILCVLVTVPAGKEALRELLLFGWEQDLQIDLDVVDDTPTELQSRHVVTLLGPRLLPAQLKAAADAIAAGGGNIDRIVRLSRYPVMSYELLVQDGDFATIRAALIDAAAMHKGELDVAIQREGLGRRAKRLVMMDVDSTLIQDEAIELLAREAGCEPEVSALTRDAMAGEIDFEHALRARVQLLKGLDEAAILRAAENMRLTPGARTFVRTLKRLGYTTAIVSGGFTLFTDRLAAEIGLDFAYANELEIVDGYLTGELVGPIVDRARKGELLRQVAAEAGIALEQTVAVGDGANDLDMLSIAGLGIAFNAKQVVVEAADTSLSVPYLDAVLFLLGISREDIEEADLFG